MRAMLDKFMNKHGVNIVWTTAEDARALLEEESSAAASRSLDAPRLTAKARKAHASVHARH
jgi:hypothetical protein